MRMTQAEVEAYQMRHAPKQNVAKSGCDKESELHEQIVNHCNSQWPRWRFIHCRMDMKSTIALGAQDFTIFMPKGRTLCVECKKKDGKLDSNQIGWANEMNKNDHAVHVVRSFEEFLALL